MTILSIMLLSLDAGTTIMWESAIILPFILHSMLIHGQDGVFLSVADGDTVIRVITIRIITDIAHIDTILRIIVIIMVDTTAIITVTTTVIITAITTVTMTVITTTIITIIITRMCILMPVPNHTIETEPLVTELVATEHKEVQHKAIPI